MVHVVTIGHSEMGEGCTWTESALAWCPALVRFWGSCRWCGAVRYELAFTCIWSRLLRTFSKVFVGGLLLFPHWAASPLGKMFNVYACSSGYLEHTESFKAPPIIFFECTEASQGGSSSHFERAVVFEFTFQQPYVTKMLLALTRLSMAYTQTGKRF